MPTMASPSSSLVVDQISSPSRNIILCFDGTAEQFGPDPFTNVLKFYRLLDHHSPHQIIYYQRKYKN